MLLRAWRYFNIECNAYALSAPWCIEGASRWYAHVWSRIRTGSVPVCTTEPKITHTLFFFLCLSLIPRSFGVQFIYIRIIFSCFSISLHASTTDYLCFYVPHWCLLSIGVLAMLWVYFCMSTGLHFQLFCCCLCFSTV